MWLRSRVAVALAKADSYSNTESKPVCNLHHSSWQCRILNPLSKARDQTYILMDISQVTTEPQQELQESKTFLKGMPLLLDLVNGAFLKALQT